jgi:energy-coupling factor transport system permease protein
MIAGSLLLPHPLTPALSLAGGLTYLTVLRGKNSLRRALRAIILITVTGILLSLLFNHSGVTVLWRPGGSPVTAEAAVYGAVTGMMIGAALIWVMCYGAVMTSDKFIYIFGRVIPGLSLILSMALRFAPRYGARLRATSEAQVFVGCDVGTGGLAERIRRGVKLLSIMKAWTLKNAADTADSMRARGYGLPGRTSFSPLRFDTRDGIALAVLIAGAVFISIGLADGSLAVQYFPSIKLSAAGPAGVARLLFFGVLCFVPALLNAAEGIVWKRLGRRIESRAET